MRSLALFLVIIVTGMAATARSEELPKRKPGFWELRFYDDDPFMQQLVEKWLAMAKMCIDETTDEKLRAAFDPCHPPRFFKFYAPQFTKEMVCTFDDAGTKTISRATIAFTGDTAYRIEIKTRFEPERKGEDELSGGRVGKWVGACPADMKPGDIVVGDNWKLDVFDKLAHPDK